MAVETESAGKTLRVLLVEDSESDAELLVAELNRSGYQVTCERVQTADELREADLKRERAREREVLEAQLRQSQKLEGIGRLAGGIAHDFNNLLTAIIGYTEMVLEQIGSVKPISKDLEEIRKASDRAAALTRQLLAFSRKQTLHVAAMDVNDIVLSMRDMLQRLIGEDVDLRVELAAGAQQILADRVQLEQVLMNLVVNARDAMPRGGTLTVNTAPALAGEAAAV